MTKIQNPKLFKHLSFDIASNLNIRISNFFFYLLILFLPTQFGRHFWPHFSNIAGIRVDYMAPTLYLTDILILLLFIVWVIEVCHRERSVAISLRLLRHPDLSGLLAMTTHLKYWKLVVFVIFLIFGILFSKNQAAGWYGFIKLLEFVFLGFYTAYNFKKLRLDIVLLLFSVSIIYESFLAILQYFNQGSIGGIFYFLGERMFNSQTPGIANASVNGELILRPYGTFSHPNVLAGFLVIAMTLIASGIKYKVSSIRKIIYLGSIAVGTVALFLTMSRVAILIWLIVFGSWLIVRVVKKIKLKTSIFYILFSIFSLLLVSFIFANSSFRYRFTNINLSDESITQRGELIRSSFEMIKSHPVFGVGLNNFLVNLPSYQTPHAPLFYLQPVHNIFILIATETGIVGFSFFVWFLFKTFKNLKIKNSFHPDRFGIKFQILLAALILGLFDHYFLTLQQGQLLFSFILGLCWSKSSKSNV